VEKGYLCWVGLLALAASGLRADTVYLTEGGTLSGIVTVDGEKVTVRHPYGCMTVPMSQVVRIERKECALAAFERQLAAVTPEIPDAAQRVWALREWCLRRGLSIQARDCETRVLELAPDFEPARRVLGFMKYQGVWLTRDEFCRAVGKVQYDGMWVTPEERAELERTVARFRAQDTPASVCSPPPPAAEQSSYRDGTPSAYYPPPQPVPTVQSYTVYDGPRYSRTLFWGQSYRPCG
jgi:hypothetical protein